MDIHKIIIEGIKKGVTLIQIPKSVYYIDRSVVIADISDVTIDGNDSTFIFTNAEDSGIELLRTSNVTLKNLKIDYDPLPYTQGVIVGMDPEGKWYDLKIDDGYRRDQQYFLKDLGGDLNFHIFDPVTRNVNRNAATVSPMKISFPQDDIIHIEPSGNNAAWNNVKIGDLAATSGSWCGVAIRLLHCAHAKIQNITIYTSAGAGIMERFGYGGADLSFRITRGDTPKGAASGRLFSTPRDGFHTTGTIKGAYVHDTFIEHNGDDGLNFWTSFFKVEEIDKDLSKLSLFTVLGDIGKNPVFFLDGDPVIIYDGKTASRKGKTSIVKADGLNVIVDEMSVIEKGDFLICPDRVARNARIEKNTFKNIDGIGLLLKAPGAIVRNNHIEGMAHAGMWVGCYLGLVEGGYLEGPFPEDLMIENNTIIDTGYGRLCRSDWFQASSGIHIGHVTELKSIQKVNREMKNITIKGNIIKSCATYGILVSTAENVIIEDNMISDSNNNEPFFVPEKLSIRKNGAIVVKSSDNVSLTNNYISNPGSYNDMDIFIDS